MSRARTHALALTMLPLAGCFGLCTPAPPDPCDLDPIGCGGPEHIEVDASCPLEGELQVEVGEGEDALHVFVGGDHPTLHYGGQGGVHMALGVRVGDPSKDYPGLEIHFKVELRECPADDPGCEWTSFASRGLVITDDDLWTITGGALETTGYIVVLDGDPSWYGSGGDVLVKIEAEVKDRCGRTGAGLFEYTIEGGGGTYGTETGGDSSTSGDTGTDTGTAGDSSGSA
ncbi:MAG: hypothetical protein R3B09_12770 [Nannocystaceae bacterium]